LPCMASLGPRWAVRRALSSLPNAVLKSDRKESLRLHIPAFPIAYPDFLQSPVWNRRVALKEELERADMLERRMNIDIPEFYVGSIMAVTSSDANLGGKEHRFLGICIRRERVGLLHHFVLRNVVDGLGVEILYEMYNPTILKIETVKLEKRLDDDLSYLIDALPEYSTFDFNLEPVAHPAGTPIPVNPLKVKLRRAPWHRRWELYDMKGIEDSWSQATPWYKRKLRRTKVNDFERYDLIKQYRLGSILDHELQVEEEMRLFEKERHDAGITKKRLLRSAAAERSTP